MQVGSGFQGMIKQMQVLDWPKTDYEFTSMTTTTCTAFNGSPCTHCPTETGN